MTVFHAQFLDADDQQFDATFEEVVLVPVPRDDMPDTVEMEPPIWTNAKDITEVLPDPLVSEDYRTKTVFFAPQTKDHVETFDVPKSVTVEGISVYNILFSQFYDCSWEFTRSEVTHPDGEGNEIEYWRYTDNRGYAAGRRKIRVLFRKE